MNTSFCKNCGAPIQPGYQVCPSCGTPVSVAPQQPMPMNNQPMGGPQMPQPGYPQPINQQPYPGQPMAQQNDNSMMLGILSIVMGAISFFFFGLACVGGIALGGAGMSQAKLGNNSGGKTVSIIGLVINIIDAVLLVIGIAMRV